MTDANGRAPQHHCGHCGVLTNDRTQSFCTQCSTSTMTARLESAHPASTAAPTPTMLSSPLSDIAEASVGTQCCTEAGHLLSNDAEAAIALLRFHFVVTNRMPSKPTLPAGATKVISKRKKSPPRRTQSSTARLHKQRCHSCRTRVGLLGFSCKCGQTFCSHHRYSDTHDCPVDHRALGRAALSAANPMVVASKLKDRI
mmetsp:Transcript_2097/g.7613  ORF Transcript_2097/g.7613 Transcript_2097/m.7613 type:complete len:199 (-) Transcript_2097:349-945(-)